MKLTQEEIGQTIDKAIAEVAKARVDNHFMENLMSPETREFGNQLADNGRVATHVTAVTMMEFMAKEHGIPETTSRTASFISAAWIGYKLREAEEAKQQVADLKAMASQ